jgi:hypothetical protein
VKKNSNKKQNKTKNKKKQTEKQKKNGKRYEESRANVGCQVRLSDCGGCWSGAGAGESGGEWR